MGIPLNPNQDVRALVVPTEGQVEAAGIVISELNPRFEVQTITCLAFASTGQADYCYLENGNQDSWAFWLDKDDDGTAPTGGIFSGAGTQVEVDIVTGDSASAVATKLAAAIDSAMSGSTAAASGAVVTITHTIFQPVSIQVTRNADDSGSGSLVGQTTVAFTRGVLESKHILFSSSDTNYAIWFNVNGESEDGSQGGVTNIEVIISHTDTPAQIAVKAANQINSEATGVNAEANGVTLLIRSNGTENVPDVAAGNSGLTVKVEAQGNAASYFPALAVDQISNNP